MTSENALQGAGKIKSSNVDYFFSHGSENSNTKTLIELMKSGCSLEICRACLMQKHDMIPLTSRQDVEGESRFALEILESITTLQYNESENLPYVICPGCLQLAKSAYFFKLQCQKSDATLRECLGTINKHKAFAERKLEDNFTFSNPEVPTLSGEACAKSTAECLQSDSLNDLLESITTSQLEDEISVHDDKPDNIHKHELADACTKNVIAIKSECPLCKKSVRFLKQHLKGHLGRVHMCDTCGKSYPGHYELLVHLKAHAPDTPYKCTICPKEFHHRYRLKQHMLGHENKKEYVCELCGKGFNRSKELSTHKRTHSGIRPHLCHICNKSFSGSDVLARHAHVHSGERAHRCTSCEASFPTRDRLAVHMRTHTGEKPYTCKENDCGRSFSTAHGLNMHLPVHTQVKAYGCLTCDKTFARSQDRRKHLALHAHAPTTASTIAPEKLALCTHCGKSFTRKADLKRHVLTHTQERPHKCSHCGKGFNQMFALTQHIRYHTGESCYICDLCGKGFMRKATLEKHKLAHAGIRNFKCDLCERAFTIRAHLVRHRRIHTGEKPYECPTCHKSFAARSGYVVHLRCHSGERPYACSYCQRTCATSTALKIHVRNHTGEKPYVCTQCGTAFARSDLRSLHMKSCKTASPPLLPTIPESHEYYFGDRDSTQVFPKPLDNLAQPNETNLPLIHNTTR